MNFTRTHTLIKRLTDIITCGKLAQMSGKSIQTVESWTRVPESNENPHGTGKKNPIDLVLRLQALAHANNDPGLSKEIADTFSDYDAYLTGDTSRVKGSINHAIGQSAKEHMDLMLVVLNSNNPDWYRANTEHKQAQAALDRVGLFIREELKHVA